ncbi:hypothetical protein WN71_004620 [Streptomyces mangrovisoli]|uniref:Uncharacterized protein n=1 Tax=Streptomyces mangrovisoli TaxID=1428628 RepID=A0A1J4P2U4_9ACTN|nr:hypothetical protein WN71_004620 [Streptomyces mangrovisoli]
MITILRTEPAFVRNGGAGVELMVIPADGCPIRVTVTGGPCDTLSRIAKRGARGDEPPAGVTCPRYVRSTTWEGNGGGAGAGFCGRVA